jgi:hypothetical protein
MRMHAIGRTLANVERFDDVEYEILERPEPPRRRRWPVVAVAAVLATGALAAGASALTTSGGDAARPAKPAASEGWTHYGDKPCKAGEGRRHRAAERSH